MHPLYEIKQVLKGIRGVAQLVSASALGAEGPRFESWYGVKKINDMEFYQNKIAVTVEELTGGQDGDAVMSYENYKKLSKRSRINVLRRGANCTPALIEYDSLPERFKVKFEAKYGDPKRMMRKE